MMARSLAEFLQGAMADLNKALALSGSQNCPRDKRPVILCYGIKRY